ncbi:TetR/AcrR family transcriptional regulator [Haliea sp. E17]|uniref:TetR/AcrR family transcriptional regulator n=1 Tax=Haliea sp. E17 TaxID=3401576 RepID=UPI003AACAEA4
MSSREDPRTIRSRMALHSAFLDLLKSHALEEITIRQICSVAKVHYTTFFRHHPSKESLLEEIAAEQSEKLVTLSLPVVETDDRHAVHLTLCNFINENRALWSALLNGGAAGTVKAELLRLCMQPAIKRVPKKTKIPVELIVISTVSVQLEALSWWLAQPAGQFSVKQLADMLDELVYTSLK